MLDLIVTELDTITGFAMDGSFRFILAELQNATIATRKLKENVASCVGIRKFASITKNNTQRKAERTNNDLRRVVYILNP